MRAKYPTAGWISPSRMELSKLAPTLTHASLSFGSNGGTANGYKNSAAEAALELFRAGARVVLVHRGTEVGKNLKYWVKPDIENRIKAGEIRAMFSTQVTRIEPSAVWVKDVDGEQALPAAQVFALTGYHPDFSFLERQGIKLDPETCRPQVNPDTLEDRKSVV